MEALIYKQTIQVFTTAFTKHDRVIVANAVKEYVAGLEQHLKDKGLEARVEVR